MARAPLPLTVSAVRKIVEQHDKYWSEPQLREELRRLSSAYATRFWQDSMTLDVDDLQVQTSDGYAFVESYVASLFARNPSIIMKAGLRSKGQANKSQAAANWWLREYARPVLEKTTRRALVYPFSAVKLYPTEATDPYRRVSMRVLNPWEVITDEESDSWDQQRWVGHSYWLPIGKAYEYFGAKQFDVAQRIGYFDEEAVGPEAKADDRLDKMLWGYIRCVELYCDGKRYYWSPQHANGEKFILVEPNPFLDYNGATVIPLVALYYSYDLDFPLRGYSALRRIYDQIREKNILRTYKARGIRKVARTYVAKKGLLDDEQKAQLAAGHDGLFLEVDEDDPSKVIVPLQHQSMPPEVDTYASQVQADMDKGSVMAPFTRGEATKATATEITALEVYSSSEIGRMARERDAFVERLTAVYLPMLSLYLKDSTEGDADIVHIDGELVALRPDDLLGDFQMYAQDSARTPLSDAARKQELMTLLGVLGQLGVPPEALLKEIARRFDLPENFVSGQVENQQSAEQGQAGTADTKIPPEQTAQLLKLVGGRLPGEPPTVQGR